MEVQIGSKKVKLSRVICLAGVAVVLLLTLAWFLPVVKFAGKSIRFMEVFEEMGSSSSDAQAGFWMMVVLCAISAIWLLIPKKWAAIVGMIYHLIPMILCFVQVSDWKSHDSSLAIGGALLIPLAIIAFVLCIAKLVVLIKEKKQA